MPERMTLIEKTVFLKSTNLFSSVPTEALAQLAARATEIHADPDEVLFSEGDEDQGTFIVVDGLVELRKGDAVVRPLRSGAAHGEFFLEENAGHQYTGIAREETHVLNIQRDDVVEVLLDVPDFGLALSRAQSLQVHRLTERVLQLEAQLKQCSETLEQSGLATPESPLSEPNRRSGSRE
ncbi:MAG TPA: cyclic nucleotide-binding domain-containing protein [Candidatus Limnocylindria bacterium]|nr:cyclic nucleotide-binding domain-containing protein [Candidatus Limnocylindria bacterium]